jgi:hypothetical protein
VLSDQCVNETGSEEFMARIWFLVVLACAACIPAGAQSQATQYQDGKIIAVNKLPGHSGSGGADAPVASQVDKYEISIQVGDTVYVCRYLSHSDEDLSWTKGKEGQVRVKGKTMYVKKVTGQEAQATILRTTKAPTP